MPPSLGRVAARNSAVSNARNLGMSAPGLARLRRNFRKLAPEVDKQLRLELRMAAKPIMERGRVTAPRRSGRLGRSLKVSVQARGVAVTSKLPYANVIHWGGSTGIGHQPGVPWSGSVFVESSLFLSRALEEQEGEVLDGMGQAVERASLSAGWR